MQCKCWSNRQGKKIHEKHINQLYGTTMMYVIEQQKKGKHYEIGYRQEDEDLFMGRVIPIFFSTVPFTDVATEFAKELRINLQQKEFEKYPMIKCNINGKGEKIYHLPFDQMYDKTIISKPGEFYAMTVVEAESKGFRRAKRWLGN